MKAKWTFALAVALLSGFAALAQAIEASSPAPNLNATFNKQCFDFCARAFCASGSCGPYIDANGQQACGCH